MLGSPKSIVARGTVFVTGSKLHNAPMPKDCMRVSIDEIVNESALLPFPISDEMKTLGSALGTHVAWPTHLVEAKDKERTKKIVVKKIENKPVMEIIVKSIKLLPRNLKALYRMMETDKDKGVHIPLDNDVFDVDLEIWILLQPDVFPFCNLEPITGNCILTYILSMKGSERECKFLFVNPFGILYEPKSSSLEGRAHVLASRLQTTTSNQLVLVPCNVSAMSTFNATSNPTAITNKKRKFTKTSNWTIIKAPQQPNSKQCGFYVMCFMR